MSTAVQSSPTAEDVALARESSRALSALPENHVLNTTIQIADDQDTVHLVPMPVSVLRLLVQILTEIGEGNAVNIIPVQAELTTQQAADVLNVSRPFFVKLLEQGAIPFHKVGAHRRVLYQDVIAYKERIDARRRQTLEELAALSQEHDMGY